MAAEVCLDLVVLETLPVGRYGPVSGLPIQQLLGFGP
jgi:hypothetical protein